MENFKLLILAVTAQAFLTVAVLVLLAARRRKAFQERKVGKDAIVNDRSWPEDVLKVSNSYKSQFEMPVLFYAAISIALATGTASTYFTILAWVFVAARIVHAAVHCGPNDLPPRFTSFLVSVFAVSAMWGVLAWRILAGV